MTGDQWPMYAWAAVVALAVLVAGWAATNRRGVRPTLPLEHVAGATLLALFGWEMLVTLPGSVVGYWTLTAGLGDVRGVAGQQAFVVAQAVFVVATAFAVGGILRRRTWGAVLGIGLASAVVVWRLLQVIDTVNLLGEAVGTDYYLELVAVSIGLGAVPALVAVVLLARPMWQPATPPVAGPGTDWSQESVAPDRPT